MGFVYPPSPNQKDNPLPISHPVPSSGLMMNMNMEGEESNLERNRQSLKWTNQQQWHPPSPTSFKIYQKDDPRPTPSGPELWLMMNMDTSFKI